MLTPETFLAFVIVAGMGLAAYPVYQFTKKARTDSLGLGGSGESVRIVTDLDRLVSGPVGFRWNGKIHVIKPMSTATFLRALNEMAKMGGMSGDQLKDIGKINRAYHGLFSTVCDTVSLKDVESMSQAQVMNLYREINRCVTGEAEPTATEKKTQVDQKSSQSMPRDSLESTAASTAPPPSML